MVGLVGSRYVGFKGSFTLWLIGLDGSFVKIQFSEWLGLWLIGLIEGWLDRLKVG